MVEMFAKDTEPDRRSRAGDIIALVSLAETETGDTLCDPASQVVLERMRFPDPVISVSVEPKTKGEPEKFGAALGKMVRADPSLRLETGSRNRADHSARHGRAAPRSDARPHAHGVRRGRQSWASRRWRIARRFTSKIENTTSTRSRPAVRASSPKCGSSSSRWSAARASSSSTTPSAARCRANTSRRSEKGLKIQKEDGVLAALPDRGLPAPRCIDGSYHDVDSNALTFEIAAKACFREAHPQGRPESCSSR